MILGGVGGSDAVGVTGGVGAGGKGTIHIENGTTIADPAATDSNINIAGSLVMGGDGGGYVSSVGAAG